MYKYEQEEEISYWLSFSDLMAGLLIVFILITVIMVFDLSESTEASDIAKKEYENMHEELKSTKDRLDNITSINDKIIVLLKKELGDTVEINEDTGAISLKSDLLFDSGKSTLKKAGREFIKINMPAFFKVLLSDKDIKDNINAIIIHGFTDDAGNYDSGLKLSQDRARTVFQYILYEPTFAEYAEDLKELVVLSGVSETRLLEKEEEESMESWRARNRRVEFQFELKFREIFETIKEQLEGDNDEN
ncbi:OmpA/MotB family protein [Vallitalea maricola]|uniref:Flagellar motor protein MotB n=1 Tax=Vallitalea maricola TaxID=3074433 RepID=A0ACB5UGM1_9FIRM|nr:flagellar motor protein MotB [Vallitalea sp. AN17-2]